MPTPNINQLKQAISIAEQIERLQAELASILGGSAPTTTSISSSSAGAKKGKHTMSAEGRARIVAAQKARWAKVKAAEAAGTAPKRKRKRKLSPEARARISAAVKARWAREKGQ